MNIFTCDFARVKNDYGCYKLRNIPARCWYCYVKKYKCSHIYYSFSAKLFYYFTSVGYYACAKYVPERSNSHCFAYLARFAVGIYDRLFSDAYQYGKKQY